MFNIKNKFRSMKKRFSVISKLIFLSALAMIWFGSRSGNVSSDSSSPEGYNYGQVVWRDLVTPNPKAAADFYKKVFGWTSTQVGTDEQPYWVFKSNGKPVGGMHLMSEARKGAGGEWVQYYSVSSLENVIKKSKTAGGELVVSPVEVEGRGTVALISDPQKAYFALLKPEKGNFSDAKPVDFEFLWNELWSNDIDKSVDFYKSTFGSSTEMKEDDDRPYTLLLNNNQPISGIIKNPVDDVRSHWMQYVKVSDVKAIQQKAIDAGANMIIKSDSTVRKGTVSIFTDPTGAPIAIQKWPIE